MDWCCLLAQNAPLQAVLLLNATPSASCHHPSRLVRPGSPHRVACVTHGVGGAVRCDPACSTLSAVSDTSTAVSSPPGLVECLIKTPRR